MTQTETNIRTITLNEDDIQSAIKYYLKDRGINDFKAEDVKLEKGAFDEFTAQIIITKTNEPVK